MMLIYHHPLLLHRIVAVYYLGTLFGGLIGGTLGDAIGRVKTIEFACIIAIIGASLQASCQNITWMMFARLITGLGMSPSYSVAHICWGLLCSISLTIWIGLGTGSLNAIVPVLASELSTHDARGAVLGFEFFLNIM
jgi:MFS family permease